MYTQPPEWIHNALSVPRFERYLTASGGDASTAIQLYHWNVAVSAAFYTPLHWIELGMRNAAHSVLAAGFGRSDWWQEARLDDNGRRMVAQACREVHRRKRTAATADDVVAELSFGFWVSLLSRGRRYDRELWVPMLHRAFPYYTRSRKALHWEFTLTLRFRNRVMHHEPIVDHDLSAYRTRIYTLLGYLSPHLAREVRQVDRLPGILDNGRPA